MTDNPTTQCEWRNFVFTCDGELMHVYEDKKHVISFPVYITVPRFSSWWKAMTHKVIQTTTCSFWKSVNGIRDLCQWSAYFKRKDLQHYWQLYDTNSHPPTNE